MDDIADLANWYLSKLVPKRTHTGKEIVMVDDGLPEEVRDEVKNLAFICHDGILPNEARWRFIELSLINIARTDEYEEYYSPEIEYKTDEVGTWELRQWIEESYAPFEYMQEYTDEVGFHSIVDSVCGGMNKEYTEVFYTVTEYLKNKLEEREKEENE